MIGAKACTAWLPPEIERDEKGFIETGQAVADAPAWKNMSRPPGPLETSWPGIFAAGDVRSGSVKRCAAAVGEGSMAVGSVHAVVRSYAWPASPFDNRHQFPVRHLDSRLTT